MCYGKTNYGKTKPAHKKLSLLSLLSLKTTLCLRILSCVCFKDNRDNRDNLQFCPSWRDFYIIDNSVLVCFFTPLADASLQVTTLISLPTHLLCSVGWCCLYCKHLRMHYQVQFELDYRHKCLVCLHSAQLSLV